MEKSVVAPRHALVRVRGGPMMLFTALCISLPRNAQHLLPVLLWLLPSLVLAKVPQLATSLLRRALEPLFLRAVAEVTDADQQHSSTEHSPSKAALTSSSSRLLNTLTQLALTRIISTGVAKLISAAPRATTQQQPQRSPADSFAALSDAALCECVVSVVVAQSAPTPSLAGLRSWPRATEGRVRAALFAASTSVAVQSYLQYVLQGHSAHAPVTLYIPGLFTAPWTTQLAPLLGAAQRRYGAQLVGYDVLADGHRYDVDLKHLRQVAEMHHAADTGEQSSATTKGAPIKATMSSLTAAARASVLFLTSLRGRRVHNRDAAFEFAKCRGWQVVELCVPTLPPSAFDASDSQGLAQALRAHSAASSPAAAATTTPDVHITSFDDAGMHGGAVVHLCMKDRRLLACMQNECQVGFTNPRTTNSGTAAAAGARRTSSTTTTAKAAAVDFTMRSSEYLTQVWLPWAGRLYHAVWAEGAALLPMAQRVQTSLAASQRMLAEMLPQLSLAVPQRVTQLLSGFASQPTSEPPLRIEDSGAGGNSAVAAARAPVITAASTVEQRTTVITHPLPSIDTPPAPRAAPATRGTTPAEAQGAVEQPLSALTAEGGGFSWASGALTSWMAHLPKPDAAAETAHNTPAEWRIRLRWTALLLSTSFDGVMDSTAAAATVAHRHHREVCAAGYVSLWSFVTQLPPWATAVTAEGEDAVHGGSGVEVAPTALLLRVAQPASAVAVAKMLREQAAVDARAVSARAWDASESGKGRGGGFPFEACVVMPGCKQAASLAEELLYVPLSPAVGLTARAAMLRVLWDAVPHAGSPAKVQRVVPLLPVQQTLHRLYLACLLSPAEDGAPTARDKAREGRTFRPLQPCSTGVNVSAQEAEMARRVLFRNAETAVARVAVPPSFVTDAARLVAMSVKNVAVDRLLSKL